MNPFESGFSGNPNRLRIRELANSRGAEFSAKTGTFYAAEWQTRIRRDHGVDENHSGVQLGYEKLLFLAIFGPRARTQTESSIVRELDGRVCIANAPL